MLRNYFLTAIRHFRRSGWYASLNVFGLAIGLATCLLIMLYVKDELSYDRYNVHASRIFRVNNEIKFGGTHVDCAQTPALLGDEAVKQVPGVKQYTRFRFRGGLLIKKGNSNLRENRVMYADSTLFDVFTLPMISGDPATALKYPRSLVITETMARKYFNSTDVAGRFLTVNDTMTYAVTGVIKDIPENSHFTADFFVPFTESARSREDNWLSENFNTYLLLDENADVNKINKEVEAMMSRFIAPELKDVLGMDMHSFTRQGNFIKCSLTPLADIHLRSDRADELAANGDIRYIYIFSLIAIFILIIACVNFMNLATARSSTRAREVGVRKVLGSGKSSLVRQFLAESVLTAFIALLLAVLITWVALPFFNTLSGKHAGIGLLLQPSMIAGLLAGSAVVGVLAGLYPAFLLSAFRPVEVLKGKMASGFKGVWLRNSLVVFQFVISITLIIGTLVIYRQLSYMRSKDLGYNRQQVLIIQNTNSLGNAIKAYCGQLSQIAGVSQWTMTDYLPTSGSSNSDGIFTSPTLDPKTAMSPQFWTGDDKYISTMGMQLKEGRGFSSQLPTDSNAIILNEAAAGFFGDKGRLNEKLY
ncbi:MAG: ABC transporter permease, partial [Bacteroidetes bacterium]|nr:ABC transporter permease [Bacteroidota bacterium]